MAPPGIISPTRVDDLPELGLIEESTPRDHDNNGSKSFMSRCCHSYCPCCESSPCCRHEPKKKKPRKGEIGIVVKKKETGQTLSEMFLTMDRRDYILTHINITSIPRKKKKRGGGRGGVPPVGIRRVNVHPTEIGLELEDNRTLSTTATFGDDDDDDVASDATKTTSETTSTTTTSTTATEATKGQPGFCAKCVSTLASPFKKTKVNEPPKVERGITKCELCPYEFVAGDDIGSSFNKKCFHKFHKECIIEWLMDHDRCPCCDREFLVEREDEPLGIGKADDEDDIFNPTGGRQVSFWTANRPEPERLSDRRATVADVQSV